MFSKWLGDKTLKLQSLEHHIHRQIKPCLKGRGFLLLAVSGGMDSMALLTAMARLRVMDLPPLHIVHIHHGHLEYRDKARDFVRKQAAAMKIPFHTNSVSPQQELHSEAELRNFRYEEIQKVKLELEQKYGQRGLVLTAHHWDDQVETRLIRLIRGTGPTGFKGMSLNLDDRLRPFLETGLDEIKAYAELLNVKYAEDPSNEETNALRNWIRNKWLPELEKKQKGSVKRMALSLEKLSDALPDEPPVGEKISRKSFNTLLPDEKSKLLVRYLYHSGARDYSGSQIRELVKRLDTPKTEHKFHLLKFEWRLNAEHIWIQAD
jgi:tRNA(Ile)-lysidine synthase